MLRMRGHPLIDAGIAALTALAGRNEPTELTPVDLDSCTQELSDTYSTNPLKSFVFLFFPNSAYIHSSMKDATRKEKLHQLLHERRTTQAATGQTCTFCGQPATSQADREHIPLLTAQRTRNFTPNGQPGLPICGDCLLAAQALPMAALPCDGRALIVHSDNPELTLAFARAHVEQKRQLCAIALASGLDKIPHLRHGRTRLLDALTGIMAELPLDSPSVSVYHFVNSGQSAAITIHHLPSELIGFLGLAQSHAHRSAWNQLVGSGWESMPERLTRKSEHEQKLWLQSRRNAIYEELFDLPEAAPAFIRRYFLARRIGEALGKRTRPNPDVPLWDLLELFLRRLMDMDRARITAIRALGDRLAAIIQEQDDQHLYRDLVFCRRYDELRTTLLKAARRYQHLPEPVVRFDEFLAIFEDDETLGGGRWRFGRDLVVMRMLERLQELGAAPQIDEEELPEEEDEMLP